MATHKRSLSLDMGAKKEYDRRREEKNFTDISSYRPSTALEIDVEELKLLSKGITEDAKKLKTLDNDIGRKRKKTYSKQLTNCENQYDFYVKDLAEKTKRLKSCLLIQDSDGQDTGGFANCVGCQQKQQTIKKLESQNKRKDYVDPAKYAIDMRTAESKISELQNEVDRVTKSVRNESATKDDALRKNCELQNEVDSLTKLVRNEFASKEDAQRKSCELQNELDNMTKRVTNESASKEDALRKVCDLQKEVDSLKRRVREEETAKDEALRRLNEPVSSKLRDNNPNIADLSDKNRPTKLAEQMSEMYDNEWTEAFDEMDSNLSYTEYEMIDFLLKAFMDIFAECKRMTTNGFFERVQACIEQTDVMQVATIHDRSDLPDTLRQHIKEFRKLNAVNNMKGIVGGILKQRGLEYLGRQPYNSKNVIEYLEKCVGISWLMCVQDPPLTLSSNKPIEFDKALYREYTRRGRYTAFIAWPIVYLHDGGPILCKGVAQGSDELPKDTPRQDAPAPSSPGNKHDRTATRSPQNQLHSLSPTIHKMPTSKKEPQPYGYTQGQKNNQMQYRPEVAPMQYSSDWHFAKTMNSHFDGTHRSIESMEKTQHRPIHYGGHRNYGQQRYTNTAPGSMNNTYYGHQSTVASHPGITTDN